MQKGYDVNHNRAGRFPPQATNAALIALVAALRDNVFLEPWAVDELADMQPDNAHAKALLCALGACDLIPPDQCEIAMLDRALGGE
jgi:hypothetical protein